MIPYFYYWHMPQISPEIFHIYGPMSLRWYNLAYIVTFIYAIYKLRHSEIPESLRHKFINYQFLSILLGGRLGDYILYLDYSNLGSSIYYFLANFTEVFYIWQGGMSFHGGIFGVIIGSWLYSRKYKVDLWHIYGFIATVVPIGIFFGRIANLINRELIGAISDASWAVCFQPPDALGGHCITHHPVQIYNALGEGLLVGIIIHCFKLPLRGPIFLISYGSIRFCLEFFKEHHNFFLNLIPMGMFWSIICLLIGIITIKFSAKSTS